MNTVKSVNWLVSVRNFDLTSKAAHSPVINTVVIFVYIKVVVILCFVAVNICQDVSTAVSHRICC